MKIVLFANGDFAINPLIFLNHSTHNLLSLCTDKPKKKGRGLKISYSKIYKVAKTENINIIEIGKLNNSDFIDQLYKLSADLFIVISFRILPSNIFNIPKYGTINLHASLLPKYRGAAPINYAILNGEKKTGLTTFIIKNKVDTGHILLQTKFNINNSITAGEMLDELSYIGANLVIKTLDGLTNNIIKPK